MTVCLTCMHEVERHDNESGCIECTCMVTFDLR